MVKGTKEFTVDHLHLGEWEHIFCAQCTWKYSRKEMYIWLNSAGSENLCHKLILDKFQKHSMLDLTGKKNQERNDTRFDYFFKLLLGYTSESLPGWFTISEQFVHFT